MQYTHWISRGNLELHLSVPSSPVYSAYQSLLQLVGYGRVRESSHCSARDAHCNPCTTWNVECHQILISSSTVKHLLPLDCQRCRKNKEDQDTEYTSVEPPALTTCRLPRCFISLSIRVVLFLRV